MAVPNPMIPAEEVEVLSKTPPLFLVGSGEKYHLATVMMLAKIPQSEMCVGANINFTGFFLWFVFNPITNEFVVRHDQTISTDGPMFKGGVTMQKVKSTLKETDWKIVETTSSS